MTCLVSFAILTLFVDGHFISPASATVFLGRLGCYFSRITGSSVCFFFLLRGCGSFFTLVGWPHPLFWPLPCPLPFTILLPPWLCPHFRLSGYSVPPIPDSTVSKRRPFARSWEVFSFFPAPGAKPLLASYPFSQCRNLQAADSFCRVSFSFFGQIG